MSLIARDSRLICSKLLLSDLTGFKTCEVSFYQKNSVAEPKAMEVRL
jgi:hypothetical protein